jgi:integrase
MKTETLLNFLGFIADVDPGPVLVVEPRTEDAKALSKDRVALKRAAAAEDCDFEGLGPDSFRRANITWRQEVGGSSIEASKIAGHSTVRMTEEYTKTQLTRQEELTRLIQERLAGACEKQPTAIQ